MSRGYLCRCYYCYPTSTCITTSTSTSNRTLVLVLLAPGLVPLLLRLISPNFRIKWDYTLCKHTPSYMTLFLFFWFIRYITYIHISLSLKLQNISMLWSSVFEFFCISYLYIVLYIYTHTNCSSLIFLVRIEEASVGGSLAGEVEVWIRLHHEQTTIRDGGQRPRSLQLWQAQEAGQ